MLPPFKILHRKTVKKFNQINYFDQYFFESRMYQMKSFPILPQHSSDLRRCLESWFGTEKPKQPEVLQKGGLQLVSSGQEEQHRYPIFIRKIHSRIYSLIGR